jgi:3-oxoacyl-[acyl-carrier-protein] synthase-1
MAAQRMLESGRYKTVIVMGGDLLSRFIVSGFQSFKALSPRPCRPFDATRQGLNLGEAAGTIIYRTEPHPAPRSVSLWAGSNCNDANHISGPSRTGEGSFQCLTSLIRHTAADDIAFVNAHGTATAYNDEMEAIALHRAGLQDVPVFSRKHQFGHTLGAAGIIESIVSMQALRNGTVLPCPGYENSGVSKALQIPRQMLHTSKKLCIKMLSGFGGSNAALLFRLNS